MKRRFGVAGGGMAGMYYAAELKRIEPSAEVHLFESASTLGGTYGSIRYAGGRMFDYGMHLVYEACDERVDRVIREVLDDDEWHFWEGNRKDIAGLYWNAHLQTGSHYVDLRRHPDGELETALFATLGQSPDWKEAADCGEYFRRKFGSPIAERILGPAQRKIWNAEPGGLDPFAVRMVSCDRVIMFDHDRMLELMKSEAIRERLAIPEQLRLPTGLRTSRQRALYPRRYGFAHYVDRFARRLEQTGVAVHVGAKILEIAPGTGGRIAMRVQESDGTANTHEFDRVYWTAPLPQLAQLTGVAFNDLAMDAPNHVAYVHLVLDRPPEMGELYYFYCYDRPYRSFRVTHYAAYCPGSATDGYAVCSEMHYPGNAPPPEREAAVEAARAELESMGVIGASHRVGFADGYVSRFGFPRPTLANRAAFAALRERIAGRIPRGLELGGVAPDLGRFFLQDVLTAAADQLAELAA